MELAMIISISSCLCLVLLLPLIRFLHKVWWTPIRLQRNNFLNWYGPKPQLVVTDPELIKEILTKDGLYQRGEIPSFVKKLIGDGILASKGQKWAKLRKIANHAFYTESLKHMIPAITASVDAMLTRWSQHEGKEIDMFEEFRVLTSEVISRTAFGSSYKEGKNIFDMLKKLAELISLKQFQVRSPLIGKLVKSKEEIEEDKLDKAIQEKVINIVKRREEQMMTGGENGLASDFLGSLIKASHDPDVKKRVSQQEIIDECKTFYNSGQDTTTSLLSWAALLLAIHTDWQHKARIEVLKVFGRENPSPEGISKLKTMSMIINETLRLYTPVLNVVRNVKSEIRLGKFVLPANMELLIPPLALHHDPNIWGRDVHLFKPERFEDGVAKATNGNSMAFLPFGYGPRFCVGMNFASAEVKIALAMVLQRYKFTLSPSYVHAPLKVLTVRPQHGVPVILQAL
ncbi:Cytochrome P450 CYP749A22 like [Actinidia chinensis var. chinensis]|uniref:Cytochrome P450 CYP749A22 like n=1 Tax=Actinidia chinensis var. chinensis TaxID=1590841 RepID=A0A2R6PB50_ACTCC|nr:Cytochrome P450 CYP749A22 like [Actinidia chinensis var. chinensis]